MNSRHMLQLFDRVRSLALALILIATFALTGCSHKQADADRLAATLQIKPGMVVADVGAGSGWMTVMMAGLVGAQGARFRDRDRSAGAGQNPERGRRGASGQRHRGTGHCERYRIARRLLRRDHPAPRLPSPDRPRRYRPQPPSGLASGRSTRGAGFPPQHPDCGRGRPRVCRRIVKATASAR